MTALPHRSARCQRWASGRHRWVPRRDGGLDTRRYTIDELAEAEARQYTVAHHYTASWPAARLRYGLRTRADGRLCGVLVLGVPMHPAVLTRPFPGLEPYRQSLELQRLVLAPAVPANGESHFTMTALRMAAADHGLRGVVAFADPIPRVRRDASGPVLVTPGHAGCVYQACSAIYTGLATPRSLTLLPDATALTARAMAKVCTGERGARGVIARLVALGAPPPDGSQPPRAWLHAALAAIGATSVRHPGNHRYLIRLGSRRQRRRTIVGLPAWRYPKRHQPSPAIADALHAAAPAAGTGLRP
ncbi:hypothetical protein [Dactylosporangium sp. CA-233914]|uniref:Mom family adenine methylcarbamoylation protein n=1 Tax=Dactylosporangium sp. CA-233914 TaxID=3239934 RepID=UPI003D8BE364